MEEIMLRIENVSKMYKLGQIGGTTLRDELQRARAKRKGLEDPTKQIGTKDYNKGETFMALDGVSFEVKKGERVGIIGHNGAGKSTLLKLISRVTAPTIGTISMNGRVASMLEVGTGFHGELTGRENIYMNGAILGMTKKEIDAKIEDIIDFSEVREFIDTPVKRYSSGMYVKLAFSVAAHLDSEIMIMDEVLAVGDMAFQKKCLDKMKSVSLEDNRTILYVSHNMSTIRQLCDRCIVLDHGKLIFDGDVEEAIGMYLNRGAAETGVDVDLTKIERKGDNSVSVVQLLRLTLLDKMTSFYYDNEILQAEVTVETFEPIEHAALLLVFHSQTGETIGSAMTDPVAIMNTGINRLRVSLPLNPIPKGLLTISTGIYNVPSDGTIHPIDFVYSAFSIQISQKAEPYRTIWPPTYWGYVRLPNCKVELLSNTNI